MTSNNITIVKEAIEQYNKEIKSHDKNDYNSCVKWYDQQTQYFRFNELIKNMDINSSKNTLLDLGCGNCELYKYINFIGGRVKYYGIDINENLLNQARERFENINISKKDILSDNITDSYDYVLISGLFNCNHGQDFEWVCDFLEKAFSMTNEILSFNAISTYVNFKDEKMFYINPEKIFSFCVKNLSKRVSIYHHNLPYNYTVQVFKDENWQSV